MEKSKCPHEWYEGQSTLWCRLCFEPVDQGDIVALRKERDAAWAVYSAVRRVAEARVRNRKADTAWNECPHSGRDECAEWVERVAAQREQYAAETALDELVREMTRRIQNEEA